MSHQNIEVHEDLLFSKENLSIVNYLDILKFGVEKIVEIEEARNQKLERYVVNLKNFIKSSNIFDENFLNITENTQKLDKNLKDFKEEAVNIYMRLTTSQLLIPTITTEKLQRKLTLFGKKLRQVERIVATKVQTFITDVVDGIRKIQNSQSEEVDRAKFLSTRDSQLITFGDVKIGENAEEFEEPPCVPIEIQEDEKFEELKIEGIEESIISTFNFGESLMKIIDNAAINLLDVTTPVEEQIRMGSSRNYIKTLKKLFETSSSEIRKSEAFRKLMKQKKISIPLPCDIKC